ncbi:hypothetical protein F441_10105 [Phytophthora nicotianae CJ01A1]|uniref:Uncharacterized protein n=5 Tax=Phytophthora nicotianae TaxID=4792 RepID=W2R7T1_PHYN3|nr:hypothetical protein PPTG_21085 [Phytophthora nicotianae INRA-310]ETI45187.1 hypothetical protein F443_10164 [Phytophthora nicotianae P1569]ETO73843.1 hypothetical protein F444_10261 [Phytophthora nicotianae P1976]ETP14996.1 hypothetical protein F441_10105 [Phytophthora nicotianae CJ01A1]ETP43081.1 hypothetical protein F442_10069 [Phytophthora nicotianae P10297]ETN21463.1 hypothetical protein PPTG_21085 [Phytophthora nicotianae INRA-310]
MVDEVVTTRALCHKQRQTAAAYKCPLTRFVYIRSCGDCTPAHKHKPRGLLGASLEANR